MDPLAVYNPVQETEFYFDGQHNGGIYNSGNLAPYIYCYQNPLKYIDPNGKQVAVTQQQQWNGAFKEMIRTFAGTLDNMGAKVSAFFAFTREIAPNTKVETTTTASIGLNNTLNWLDAKQFDQNTSVTPYTAKIETKVEVKVTLADIKAKVEGVDVNTKVSNVTNITAGTNKIETKTVVGNGQNGLFISNSTNTQTGKNTTRAGFQLQAETPKVKNTTFKVGMSASMGQKE